MTDVQGRAAKVRELMGDAVDYVGSDWFFDFKVPALFRAIADYYDHSTDDHDDQIRKEARASIRARTEGGDDVTTGGNES